LIGEAFGAEPAKRHHGAHLRLQGVFAIDVSGRPVATDPLSSPTPVAGEAGTDATTMVAVALGRLFVSAGLDPSIHRPDHSRDGLTERHRFVGTADASGEPIR